MDIDGNIHTHTWVYKSISEQAHVVNVFSFGMIDGSALVCMISDIVLVSSLYC
jgi:hypothetical protein